MMNLSIMYKRESQSGQEQSGDLDFDSLNIRILEIPVIDMNVQVCSKQWAEEP